MQPEETSKEQEEETLELLHRQIEIVNRQDDLMPKLKRIQLYSYAVRMCIRTYIDAYAYSGSARNEGSRHVAEEVEEVHE